MSNKVFEGFISEYVYADDNENGNESIIMDASDGRLIEFEETDIKEIVILDREEAIHKSESILEREDTVMDTRKGIVIMASEPSPELTLEMAEEIYNNADNERQIANTYATVENKAGGIKEISDDTVVNPTRKRL